MAKGAVSGDISEWEGVNGELVRKAFRRGVATGAASGSSCDASLSALKKIVPAKCYDELGKGLFAAATKDTGKKLKESKFMTKDFFIKMCGSEAAAKKVCIQLATDESAKLEKEGQVKAKGSDVTSRLTDTSKYTGAHKERFDESGKGKGASGRVDAANSSGYVGNYKGEGTWTNK